MSTEESKRMDLALRDAAVAYAVYKERVDAVQRAYDAKDAAVAAQEAAWAEYTVAAERARLAGMDLLLSRPITAQIAKEDGYV
jgi:hypothetical protein